MMAGGRAGGRVGGGCGGLGLIQMKKKTRRDENMIY